MGRRGVARVPVGDPGAPLTHTGGAQGGSSLVELLTSTLCLSMLMAMAISFARTVLVGVRLQEARSEAQEATVMALDLMVRELRMAGYSAAGQPLLGVTAAAADRVEIASDITGDGTTADANELIAYSYNEDAHQLTRATGGASPQPLVPHVPPGGLQLSYFEASGAQIRAPAAGLAAAERQRIRRIDVILRVEEPNPDPLARAPFSSTVSGSVALRNP